MLGSVSEAEDVVQEGLLRLHRATESGTQVESPEAFLVAPVTRLAIDELRSARARREVYVGDWLPEPILTAEDEDPERHAEIADSLSIGLLVVLERSRPSSARSFSCGRSTTIPMTGSPRSSARASQRFASSR